MCNVVGVSVGHMRVDCRSYSVVSVSIVISVVACMTGLGVV